MQDMDRIEDEKRRAECERRALLFGKRLLIGRAAFENIEEVVSEAAALRAEVESLQAQVALATAVGVGPKARFLSAAETLTQWRELCSEAESFIYIACFMFDLPNVVTMLEMARPRRIGE